MVVQEHTFGMLTREPDPLFVSQVRLKVVRKGQIQE